MQRDPARYAIFEDLEKSTDVGIGEYRPDTHVIKQPK